MSTHDWSQQAERLRPIADPAVYPIYRQDDERYALFYAPGCLCVTALPAADRFEAALCEPRPTERGWSSVLRRQAEEAVAQSTRQQHEPFAPECLTLYVNNECTLNCVYCYADPTREPADRLEASVIAAAARRVAAFCRQKDLPLTAVFHGGGEPTLHRAQVDQALALLETVARENEVNLYRYVASNGVLCEDKARWLANHFDLVGLSCDGPPDVQNRQRPRRDGSGSAQVVGRTARILRDEGRPYQVRTTITNATLHRQAELADYVCRQFSPQEIHFEPVYRGGRVPSNALSSETIGADRAVEFAEHLTLAQIKAAQYGVPLKSSGSRLAEIHGPYCNVFRSVLNLVPGGAATACFKYPRTEQVVCRGLAIGALNAASGAYEIDDQRVEALRGRLGTLPAGCERCVNRYHCVRGCPDICPLDAPQGDDRELLASFRCRSQKALTAARLHRAADKLWAEREATGTQGAVYGTLL